MVENIVRKGEIACYKQFLLFLRFPQLYIFSASKCGLCGNGLNKKKNMEGKGANVCYHHFLLFPKCFQKRTFSCVVKSGLFD